MRVKPVSQNWKAAIALAEIVPYVIEDARWPLLHNRAGRIRLGGIVPEKIHIPRFQEHILSQRPWMRGQKAGKRLYIACDTAIGKAAARELQ